MTQTTYPTDLLTPWFPGSIKPARPGVYERAVPNFIPPWFSRFDGRWWYCGSSNSDTAGGVSNASLVQHAPWRGLAEMPIPW